MIKERIPISGDLKSKVKQLMEYAGWQEGRKVTSHCGAILRRSWCPYDEDHPAFYRKYFGLCCECIWSRKN